MADDYLSDAFLLSETQEESYSKKRTRKLNESQVPKKQPKQSLQDKMAEKISQDNKGFKMLQKMGYTPGQSLKEGGIVEPIYVDLEQKREGLGSRVKTFDKNEFEKREESFKQQMRHAANDRVMKKDIRACRLACQDLDERNQKQRSELWLPLEEEDPFGELEPEEQLVKLVVYLKEYLYCIWCGTRYDSLEEMEQECPGTTRQDHDD
ncbi:hypothetical protein EDD86DRAFT_105214 [Gorgonomyces haynaldii]|nr:hypothetical protein EDD86DRAFT_105214 [Gorgonomyces haynaldii]